MNGAELWWKYLWRLNVPSKIKLFLWKSCKNWIPTPVNLLKHGMNLDIVCPICLKKEEMTVHALWTCSSLKDVRVAWGWEVGVSTLDRGSFLDFVISLSSEVDVQKFESMSVVWWRIWFRRNSLLHGKGWIPAADVLDWAGDFLQSYRTAMVSISSKMVVEKPVARWMAHPQGVFKINTDAALDFNNKTAGFGVVIRDSLGRVLMSFCRNF